MAFGFNLENGRHTAAASVVPTQSKMKKLILALLLAYTAFGADRFIDRIWLHCHLPRTYSGLNYGLDRLSVEPIQAAEILGLENLALVRYVRGENAGPMPGRHRETYDKCGFDKVRRVGWSLSGEGGHSTPGERGEVMTMAAEKCNIELLMWDDFRPDIIKPEEVPAHSHAILYNDENSFVKLAPWISKMESVSVWLMYGLPSRKAHEVAVARLEWHLQKLPNPPKLWIGLYAWDFFGVRDSFLGHTGKPIDPEVLRSQLAFAKEGLLSGRFGGVFICSSAVVSLDGPAGEATRIVRDWIAENRDLIL